jgi:peptide/nickel transport system substrate-binding protein
METMSDERLLSRGLSRRQLLRAGAAAGLGATMLPGLLAACGGDDDDDADAPTAASSTTPAAGETAAPGSTTPGETLSGVNAADAVATANAGKEPKSGGTLVWGMGGDADALDPHTTNAWAAWRQATLMYESLVRKDLLGQSLNVEIVPQLAESWEVAPDGLKYTFTLRQGVTFHDGSAFNAEAVKANYERNAVPESEYYYANAWHGSIAFPSVASVETPDEHTFIFNMATPLIEFLAAIGDYYWFGIASPTRIKEVGNENLAANPSGTGPFKFAERVEGDHTTFERFEEYWGEKAYLDRLIVRPILDDSTRVVALQNGEIDLMSDPPPDVIQSLLDSGYVLSQGTTPQVAYYRFNFKNEFGSNQKVRQAVNYALNRDSIATDLFRDTVIPAYGILSPGAPAYDPAWKPVSFDPDRARQLLAEAGFPDGFKTKLLAAPTASGWPQAGATAQLIQSNLKDVGIELELELTEWVTYLGINFAERTDAMLWGTAWGMPTNFFLNIEFESVNHNEETDTYNTFYNTPQNPIQELDDMLIAAKQETDVEKANELYRQINQRVAVDDAAVLAINHDKLPHLLREAVRGFVHSVNVNYDMSKVWLDT